MISAAFIDRPIFGRKHLARQIEIMPGAVAFELHQLDEGIVVRARQQIGGPDAEAVQILLGNVDAPALGVTLNVAQNIDELQCRSQVHGVIPRAGILITENLDANQSDG